MKLIILIVAWIKLVRATCDDYVIYDRYTGKPASPRLLRAFAKTGVTNTCTIKIKPCDPNEGRRVDGACNNLDHPAKGVFQVPQARMLPAHFHNGAYPRKAVSGDDLELPRVIRTALLFEGKIASTEFTQAMPAFAIWFFGDIGSVHDIVFFIANKTDCCEPEHMNDYMCTPNIYPEDDPVHRFSGIRCTNLTRPLDHQYLGCTNDTTPSPISPTTAVVDLSQLYNLGGIGDKAIRSYKGGQLAVDIDEDGIVWPPNGNGICMGNRVSEGETRCFANYGAPLLSLGLISVWFMRNHNYYATKLAQINPCWDDDKLFKTAREINMASYQQFSYYELFYTLIGEDNLIARDIISKDSCCRDTYDNKQFPLVYLEFLYALRWFHVAQEPIANKYSPNGTYIGNVRSTNVMFRPGFLGVDKNIVKYTPGIFRQNTAAIDYNIDPDLAEAGLNDFIQRSVDITTSDLHKGRTLGMAPYIDYVHFCTGHKITTWDDLKQHVSQKRINQLRLVYADPPDVDLMAGMWSENIIKGGKIPATLACILMKYLKKAIISDRHWYERCNRTNAFTAGQLKEVRKSTIAQLICNNADGVTEIQRHALLAISPKNPLVDCCEIENIDLTAWADPKCNVKTCKH